ncbi:MAG: hypothetical protein ACK5XN_22285, partial [Bacteroidota bacterium]
MTIDAAIQILDDGHIIVDSQHADARHLLQHLNTWGRIYAYSGRYVRAKIDRITLWSAAAQGIRADEIIAILRSASHDVLSPTVQHT